MQPEGVNECEKNHATSPHTKSRNLSTQKKALQESQSAALRTSHWLSNVSNCSSQKYFYTFYSSDSSKTNHATSPQKKSSMLFFYFVSTFGKSNLTHLTTDVMFSGQRDSRNVLNLTGYKRFCLNLDWIGFEYQYTAPYS